MFLTSLVYAIGTISAVHALPKTVRSPYSVKERHNVPREWTKISHTDKSQTIHLAIGLKQQNEGVVEEHLLQVSDPSHHRYGKHLTAAEIQDIVRPSQESQDLVKSWLEEHGISGFHNPANDFIHVVIPVEKAEALLDTTYSKFQHKDGTVLDRAPEWSLPLHLHDHIDVVQPTTSFFRTKRSATKGPGRYGAPPGYGHGGNGGNIGSGNGAGPISQICNISFTTPDCIRTLYGTYDYKPQVPGKNKIGHTNYLNESSYRPDIRKALQAYRPEAVEAADTFTVINIAGAREQTGPYTAEELADGANIEAVLDSENILTVAWPTPLIVFSTGGSPPFIPDIQTPTNTNEPYLVWLDYVLNQQDLPQVISTSYGDDEQTVPESYAKRVCAGMAQLGARGISILFSSGDAGVGADGTCYSNDGKNTSMFLPAFPAGCPWVTAVGGTENFAPEVAVNRFASGAGFSNYFPAPKYGQSTWNAYVKGLNGLHDGLYNKEGRAYPDVAAQGNHDAIAWNNTLRTVGGTSASSPTFAAVISLVNDALLAKGKAPLGFLNPWIYSGGYKALTDVTNGTSYGCNTTGFPAKAGWDAVTGFGTPNFPKLVEAAFEEYGSKPY
ncbi:uncharacterized protein MYCFIDRAFT_60025 [Pseudocercospora fijiensis CIRAD86]|uniref:tripeptidyl-peptidase II n=1 Tax=Pseudocercospora fijiensis (strain CIRAD86) TaxID=383855 RepID=M3A1N2_PSEFD|nr:uncharacterized protein MYCFIDRAFT_60025 [Pseudocercospora fijiensis CIRAD86]EME85089.1 hypothetical protein MYCFIDRAFT_60025 [Pseudocercospora fijiensis CIRAD86]